MSAPTAEAMIAVPMPVEEVRGLLDHALTQLEKARGVLLEQEIAQLKYDWVDPMQYIHGRAHMAERHEAARQRAAAVQARVIELMALLSPATDAPDPVQLSEIVEIVVRPGADAPEPVDFSTFVHDNRVLIDPGTVHVTAQDVDRAVRAAVGTGAPPGVADEIARALSGDVRRRCGLEARGS